MYKLPVYQKIKERIEEPRKFIQVVMGPRQVGKSTVVKQVLNDIDIPYKFFAADSVPTANNHWILDCWETARTLVETSGKNEIILVIDEIQKIDNWSEIVKKLYDEDTFYGRNIKVLLLGSSRVLLKKGLSESLMGRFEEIRMSQWTFGEVHECFGLSLNEYLYYGGYPGALFLIKDQERYENYINSSIIDATINRDILIDTPISKPALLRTTFELSAAYSGQELSYNKMLGQLQDSGNTVTIAQYLYLLNEACMVAGLHKYTNDSARARGTIPKFQVYDSSLKNFYNPLGFEKSLTNPSVWGRVFESGIGAYIMDQSFLHNFEVFYWREKDLEVDFIIRKRGVVAAIEVKSNNERRSSGLEEFRKKFNPHRSLLVGNEGLTGEEFLRTPLIKLFE